MAARDVDRHELLELQPVDLLQAEQAGPDLAKTIDLIQEQLTDENMQELNARVDLDKKDPAEVAKEYLTETGLISGG